MSSAIVAPSNSDACGVTGALSSSDVNSVVVGFAIGALSSSDVGAPEGWAVKSALRSGPPVKHTSQPQAEREARLRMFSAPESWMRAARVEGSVGWRGSHGGKARVSAGMKQGPIGREATLHDGSEGGWDVKAVELDGLVGWGGERAAELVGLIGGKVVPQLSEVFGALYAR